MGGTGSELDGPAETGFSCNPSFSRQNVSPLTGNTYAGGGSVYNSADPLMA